MSATAWLEQHAPGFMQLSPDERRVILEFSLLWSLFETEVLRPPGNTVERIESAVMRWSGAGLLTPDTFADQVAYFRAASRHSGPMNAYRYGREERPIFVGFNAPTL